MGCVKILLRGPPPPPSPRHPCWNGVVMGVEGGKLGYERSFLSFHLARCLHLESSSERTLRLFLLSSFRMWCFSAMHSLQSLQPGLYAGAFSMISQESFHLNFSLAFVRRLSLIPLTFHTYLVAGAF